MHRGVFSFPGIWRTPYSEKKGRSPGIELACSDERREESQGHACMHRGVFSFPGIWRMPYSEKKGRSPGIELAGEHARLGERHQEVGADMSHIIVAFGKRENAANIRNVLVRSGMEVSAACLTGTKVLQYTDTWNEGIIICGYTLQDMQYTELREYLPESFQMLLIASPTKWSDGLPDGVVGLPMPIKVYDLINTVEMMIQTMERQRRKRRGRARERSTGEKQVIEEAKALLMERNNMTEEEAHRYVQKSSMESGTNMSETAQMILTIMNE